MSKMKKQTETELSGVHSELKEKSTFRGSPDKSMRNESPTKQTSKAISPTKNSDLRQIPKITTRFINETNDESSVIR